MSKVSAPTRPDSCPPTCEAVFCDCIRQGNPAKRELTFVWQNDDGEARLNIFSEKRVRTAGWRKHDIFRVIETPSPLGRAWVLYRSPEAIAADIAKGEADPDQFYGVLVSNEQDRECTCKGFMAHGHVHNCKHLEGILWALERGFLDSQPIPACVRCHERPADCGTLCGDCGQDLHDEQQAEEAAAAHDAEEERFHRVRREESAANWYGHHDSPF